LVRNDQEARHETCTLRAIPLATGVLPHIRRCRDCASDHDWRSTGRIHVFQRVTRTSEV